MSLDGEVVGDHTEILPEEFIGRGKSLNEALSNARSNAQVRCREEGYELFSEKWAATPEGDYFCVKYNAMLKRYTVIRKEPAQVVTIFPGVN